MRGMALILMFALALATGSFANSSPAQAQGAPATIEMKLIKVAGVIGVSGGRGTLYYNGMAYPLRVGGVSLGLGFALAAYDLKGTVYNLRDPADIYGTYTAASAGAAFVGGAKVAVLTNARGVRLEVGALTVGVELQIDLSGISISPGR
jgi:hypothetical protein